MFSKQIKIYLLFSIQKFKLLISSFFSLFFINFSNNGIYNNNIKNIFILFILIINIKMVNSR